MNKRPESVATAELRSIQQSFSRLILLRLVEAYVNIRDMKQTIDMTGPWQSDHVNHKQSGLKLLYHPIIFPNHTIIQPSSRVVAQRLSFHRTV